MLLAFSAACGWTQSNSGSLEIERSGVAVSKCLGEQGEAVPSSKIVLDELKALLLVDVVRCEHRPAFQAFRGAILLALGYPAEAAIHLERALMLDPEFAGAKVDYAQALALLGDLKAAEALITELLERQDVPSTLRAILEVRLKELRQRASWTFAATSALRTGFDTNLNSAPYRDLLTLTLPGGETVLLLSPDFRAREGRASVLDLGLRTSRVLELSGSGLSVSADLKVRQSNDVPSSDFAQGDIQILNSFAVQTGELLVGNGSSIVSFSGGGRFQSAYLSFGHQWSYLACRPRLMVNFEGRRFPVNSYLDGRYTGLIGNAVCTSHKNRLGLTVRSGTDYSVGDRPGGKQVKLDMRVNWVSRIGLGILDVDLTWAQQLDEIGYSPLLENSARRRVSRFAARSEFSWPLGSKWDSFINIENSYQKSNLELFQVKGIAVYVGIRWMGSR
jgi:hypothetical protein